MAMLTLKSVVGDGGESFLASSYLLVVAGDPWHSLICSSLTPVSASGVPWHSPCVSVSLSYEDSSHIGLRPH